MKLARRVASTVTATAFSTAVLLGSMSPALADRDLDCADFSTQREAQAEFESHERDIHRLDGDNDGKACEHLPKGDKKDDKKHDKKADKKHGKKHGKHGKKDHRDRDKKPVGGVATGGGGTADGSASPGMIAVGGGLLVAAGGAAVATRRLRGDH